MARKIDENTREFIRLYGFEGKKIAQISKIMNVPQSTLYDWSHDVGISAKVNAAREKALQEKSLAVSQHFLNDIEKMLNEYDHLMYDADSTPSIKEKCLRFGLDMALNAHKQAIINDNVDDTSQDVMKKIKAITSLNSNDNSNDNQSKILNIVNSYREAE